MFFQVRNLSDWVDAKPFMKVFVNELPASDEDIAQIEGLNQGLCLRLCLLPMGPDSFTLQVEKEKGIQELIHCSCYRSSTSRGAWPSWRR